MKKLIGVAAFAAMIVTSGGNAFADNNASFTVPTSGTIPSYCTTAATLSQGLTISGIGSYVPQGATASPTTLSGTPFPTVSLGSVTCTMSGAQIKLSSAKGCLTQNANCNTGGDGHEVWYQAVATLALPSGTIAATLNANKSMSQIAPVYSAAAGAGGTANLSLTLTPYGNTNTLLAGTFSDTITVGVGTGL